MECPLMRLHHAQRLLEYLPGNVTNLGMYVSREELRQKAEEEASKRQKEAQEYLKRVHAISAERRAKAAAHLRAKAAV